MISKTNNSNNQKFKVDEIFEEDDDDEIILNISKPSSSATTTNITPPPPPPPTTTNVTRTPLIVSSSDTTISIDNVSSSTTSKQDSTPMSIDTPIINVDTNKDTSDKNSNNSNIKPQKSSTIELQRFFGYNQFESSQQQGDLDDNSRRYQNLPSLLTFHSDICFLLAPPKCLKTTLLFQYGYSVAREGKFVLFICNKKKFEESSPFGTPSHLSIENGDPSFKNIKIKQFDEDSNLRNYLMEFPTFDMLPDLILIDDYTFCFESNGNLFTDYGKTLAYLKDTLFYINSKRQTEKQLPPCTVIIADNSLNDKFHYSIPRWSNLILTVEDPDLLQFQQQQQQQQLLQLQSSSHNQQYQQQLQFIQTLKERNFILKIRRYQLPPSINHVSQQQRQKQQRLELGFKGDPSQKIYDLLTIKKEKEIISES